MARGCCFLKDYYVTQSGLRQASGSMAPSGREFGSKTSTFLHTEITLENSRWAGALVAARSPAARVVPSLATITLGEKSKTE